MNCLFLSRSKSHPPFLYHDHLCLDPQHQKKVVLHLSIANVNGGTLMDFKGIRIWAFENAKDINLGGTMLHSKFLDLLVFVSIYYTGRSHLKQPLRSSRCPSHCKPPWDSYPYRNIQQNASVCQKHIPHLLASLC